MEVYLIRHGEVLNPDGVEYGRLPGFPLSASGRKQIESLSLELVPSRIEKIFSSPLLRTHQTAAILSEKLGVSVVIDERLLEIDLGRYQGQKRSEFLPLSSRFARLSDLTGAEDLLASGQRLLDLLNDLTKEGSYKIIAAVSHQAPLAAAKLLLDGKGEESYGLYKKEFPLAAVVKIEC